jgi:ABC-2 type transport system permease protein
MCYSMAVGDEMSGWERMRLTLPMGRSVVVRSRYVSVILIAVVTCVFALILNVVLLAVIGAIPQLSSWLGGMAFTGDKVAGMLASAVLAFAMCLLFCSFTLPAMFRFGITRATRFIPVLAVVVMLAVFAVLSEGAGIIASLDAMSPFMVAVAAILVGVAVCAASAAIAARMLERREF